MLSKLLLSLGLVWTCCVVAVAMDRPMDGASTDGWNCPNAGPFSIGFPEFCKPGTEKTYPLKLPNCGVVPITVDAFVPAYDSSNPSGLTDWLGYIGPTGVILPGDSLVGTIQVNKAGIITGLQPKQVWGRLQIIYTEEGQPQDTVDVRVAIIVADTVVSPRWDTLATACTKLTVGTDGNIGHNGLGGANMNYVPPAECDTGGNSRGNAAIYLFDGSPVVLRKTAASSYTASWSMYGEGFESAHGLKPLFGFSAPQHITTDPVADIYKSGTFCTVDSLVKVEKMWIAPKGRADTCKFIIERTQFFGYTIACSVPALAIGEAVDWDVPSDSGANTADGGAANVAGEDWAARKLLYMRGIDSPDGTVDCRDNNLRYAGVGVLAVINKICSQMTPYGGYLAANDSFVYPTGNFVPAQLWANMQAEGVVTESRHTDLHAVLTYRNMASTGYTLPANDTLTVFTALISIPSAETVAAGLDSLKAQYDRANRFLRTYGFSRGWLRCACSSCCAAVGRGNVNCVGIVDLADLSAMICYLSCPIRPGLCCPDAANVNGTGIIDLSDLSLLICYLTCTPKPVLPPCGC